MLLAFFIRLFKQIWLYLMGTSDIAVSGLVAVPRVQGNKLAWTVTDNWPKDSHYSLSAVEVHASLTNDRATATKVGEGQTDFLHAGLSEEVTWYYWIKARNKVLSGSYGPWHPSSATAGVASKALGQAGTSLALTNGKLVVTHNAPSANQLKIEVKTAAGTDPSASDPIYVAFVNNSGAYSTVAITSALSLTIPNGNTIGTVSNLAFRIWVLLFNDAGTLRLAVTRRFDGSIVYPLADFGQETVSSEATVGAGNMDSAGVIYSSTAILLAPYRIIGYFESTGMATAGQWDTAVGNVVLSGPSTPKPGDVLQEKTRIDKTVTTGTTTIPFDDTIPQNTEGVEVVNNTGLAAQSLANAAELEISLNAAYSVAANLTLSVFSTAGASALASSFDYVPAANAPHHMQLKHVKAMESGSFFWRAGGDAAGTLTVNGTGGARKLGGTLATAAVLREIQV